MPTVRGYTDEAGFYIRANIDGRFVTLQLSPAVEGLLTDLEYTDGDSIAWPFLHPLCERGHVYTNKSGTEVSTGSVDTEESVSSPSLGAEEKRRLQEFLKEDSVEEQSGSEIADPKKSSDDPGTVLKDTNAPIRQFVEQWSPTEQEYEATLNRIARAGHSQGILNSITHHAERPPLHPDRFRVSSRGVPIYSFTTDGIPWTVHDYGSVRTPATDTERYINIRPGTSRSQSLTITPESTEWHTGGSKFSQAQIDDFLAVVPDLLYYYHSHPSQLTGSPYGATDNADAGIAAHDKERAGVYDKIEPVTPGEYDRAVGLILSLDGEGEGRIRSHTGHTFAYSSNDFLESDIDVDDFVTFDIAARGNDVYACKIAKQAIDHSVRDFLRGWPDWHDQSIDSVLGSDPSVSAHTVKEESIQQMKSISIAAEIDEAQSVELEIDILLYQLACTVDADKEEPSDALDTAVRSLLKETIDGQTPAVKSSVVAQSIEVELPPNLLSMIDSVVETTTVWENRSEFFNAALEQQLDTTEVVDLTVQIPQSHSKAIAQITNEVDKSTDDFVRTAIEDALRSAVER